MKHGVGYNLSVIEWGIGVSSLAYIGAVLYGGGSVMLVYIKGEDDQLFSSTVIPPCYMGSFAKLRFNCNWELVI